jgi:hypothetical protein
MIRPVTHLLLHFIVPGIAARCAFTVQWKKAWAIMLVTMIVDLDHLLASPVFDPNRCSIGFHPMHSYPTICCYLLMTLIPKSRIIGVGLLIHMALDGIDCFWMTYI